MALKNKWELNIHTEKETENDLQEMAIQISPSLFIQNIETNFD